MSSERSDEIHGTAFWPGLAAAAGRAARAAAAIATGVVIAVTSTTTIASAAPKAVRDNLGQVIGYLDEQSDGSVKVRDCHSVLLGYSNRYGTYDALGVKLYDSQVPQLLLQRSKCGRKAKPGPGAGS